MCACANKHEVKGQRLFIIPFSAHHLLARRSAFCPMSFNETDGEPLSEEECEEREALPILSLVYSLLAVSE